MSERSLIRKQGSGFSSDTVPKQKDTDSVILSVQESSTAGMWCSMKKAWN